MSLLRRAVFCQVFSNKLPMQNRATDLAMDVYEGLRRICDLFLVLPYLMTLFKSLCFRADYCDFSKWLRELWLRERLGNRNTDLGMLCI